MNYIDRNIKCFVEQKSIYTTIMRATKIRNEILSKILLETHSDAHILYGMGLAEKCVKQELIHNFKKYIDIGAGAQFR